MRGLHDEGWWSREVHLLSGWPNRSRILALVFVLLLGYWGGSFSQHYLASCSTMIHPENHNYNTDSHNQSHAYGGHTTGDNCLHCLNIIFFIFLRVKFFCHSCLHAIVCLPSLLKFFVAFNVACILILASLILSIAGNLQNHLSISLHAAHYILAKSLFCSNSL